MSHQSPLRCVPLLGLLLALGVATLACGGSSDDSGAAPPTGGLERIEVRIDGSAIQAEVARTPGERAQGLSGRPSLPGDAGMLFVFEQENRWEFWMRGMLIPLDFIWISGDRRVVDVTENAPAPEAGTSTSDLPSYQPAVPVLYVLEVNAGVVEASGIHVGDTVTFEPDISPTGPS